MILNKRKLEIFFQCIRIEYQKISKKKDQIIGNKIGSSGAGLFFNEIRF